MKKEKKLKDAEAFGVNFIVSNEPSKVDMEKLMASEKMIMANKVAASLLFSNKSKKKRKKHA